MNAKTEQDREYSVGAGSDKRACLSYIFLSDESVYVRTDDEAAERDGVKNYN